MKKALPRRSMKLVRYLCMLSIIIGLLAPVYVRDVINREWRRTLTKYSMEEVIGEKVWEGDIYFTGGEGRSRDDLIVIRGVNYPYVPPNVVAEVYAKRKYPMHKVDWVGLDVLRSQNFDEPHQSYPMVELTSSTGGKVELFFLYEGEDLDWRMFFACLFFGAGVVLLIYFEIENCIRINHLKKRAQAFRNNIDSFMAGLIPGNPGGK